LNNFTSNREGLYGLIKNQNHRMQVINPRRWWRLWYHVI